MTTNGNGWEEWSKYVLFSINKMWDKLGDIEKSINMMKLDFQKDIVTLQVKSCIWGSIGGILVSLGIAVVSGVLVYHLTTSDVDTTKINPPQPTAITTTP